MSKSHKNRFKNQFTKMRIFKWFSNTKPVWNENQGNYHAFYVMYRRVNLLVSTLRDLAFKKVSETSFVDPFQWKSNLDRRQSSTGKTKDRTAGNKKKNQNITGTQTIKFKAWFFGKSTTMNNHDQHPIICNFSNF